MMQEDGSSQPFYGSNDSKNRRYEPPPQELEAASPQEHDYYTSASVQQPLVQETFVAHTGERKKNFPPCRPIVHHNIQVDIIPEKRLFIRQAYVGWYFHCFCLLWNFICLLGGLIAGEGSLGGFFLGLVSLVLGPPVSFFVYFMLYRAIRSASAFFFVIWFALFVGQLAAQCFYALGFVSYGAAGFMFMIYSFFDQKIILGVLATIATFMWVGVFLYSLWLFYKARLEFKNLGGAKAATKEFAKRGIQTAYDNRETVKNVIVENKDTIKQVAMDNKDTIINFAKEHKEELIAVAQDNKEAVARVAMENQDAIWQNKEVIASVFDDHNKV